MIDQNTVLKKEIKHYIDTNTEKITELIEKSTDCIAIDVKFLLRKANEIIDQVDFNEFIKLTKDRVKRSKITAKTLFVLIIYISSQYNILENKNICNLAISEKKRYKYIPLIRLAKHFNLQYYTSNIYPALILTFRKVGIFIPFSRPIITGKISKNELLMKCRERENIELVKQNIPLSKSRIIRFVKSIEHNDVSDELKGECIDIIKNLNIPNSLKGKNPRTIGASLFYICNLNHSRMYTMMSTQKDVSKLFGITETSLRSNIKFFRKYFEIKRGIKSYINSIPNNLILQEIKSKAIEFVKNSDKIIKIYPNNMRTIKCYAATIIRYVSGGEIDERDLNKIFRISNPTVKSYDIILFGHPIDKCKLKKNNIKIHN
jgi:hypothetical protein